MVKHAVEIGWTPIVPDEARQKRGGESGMLFRDELAAKLAEYNPWLKPDAVRSITESFNHRRQRRPCTSTSDRL